MPVIQLPQDTRWGDIGKGLSSFTGQLVTAYQDNKISQGVAQILQDPTISEADKSTKIFEQFGQQGQIKYGELLKAQHTAAQTKNLLAESALTAIRARSEEAKAPYVAPQAEANVAHTGAQTAQTQQTTAESQALLPGRVTQQGAQTGETIARTSSLEAGTDKERLMTPGAVTGQAVQNALGEARVPLVRSEAAKTGLETQMLQQQLDRNTKLLAQGQTDTGTLDKMLDEAGIRDPGQRAAAKMEYGANLYAKDPAKAGEAFAASISKSVNSQAAAKTRAEAPTEAGTKEAVSAAEHAESAERFLKSFKEGGARKLGFFQGANLKTTLERYGIPVGDPELLEMWNAAAQQVQSTATSGGGFYAEGRKRLAESVTPGITESPLHAIIAADQVSDRMIARLKTRQLDHPEQKSIQTALDRWQNVKKTTGSLDTYDYVPDPKNPRDKKPVVLFNGDQVDPKTFAPIVEGKRDYNLGKNVKLFGSDLIADARRRNMSPFARLEELKAQYGGGPKGSQ